MKRAGELPQSEAVWECSVRKAPSWVETKGGKVTRMNMVIVADAQTGFIRHQTLQKAQNSVDSVITGLLQAMLEPMGSQFMPAEAQMHAERPTRVKFDWHARLEDVQKSLSEIGVTVEPADNLPMCDEFYQSLLEYTNPGPRPPAISRIAPEDAALTREFFESAGTFYRSAVWQYVFNDDIIEVRYGDEPARYCSIMGNGGQEFGIVLYQSQDDVVNVLSSEHPLDMRRGMIWLTTSFDEAFVSAIEDIDYLEKHALSPADMMGYPLFLRVRMPAGMETPDVLDLKISAAALRALPQFVVASMMAGEGEPQPATARFALPEVHAGKTLTLSYPLDGLEAALARAEAERGDSMAIGDERVFDMLNALDPDDDALDEFEDDAALEEQADALEAEMIKLAEELEPGAGRLLQAINTVQPAVSFKAEKDIIDKILPTPKGMKAGVFYEAFSTLYADPRIGILVAFVLPRSETPIIIPLSLLDVDPAHPLADAIVRYQQSHRNTT